MTAAPIATVTGRTSAAAGEYTITARGATVRSDARNSGGPEIHAGELLLAALASCALAVIEGTAAEEGLGLGPVTVEVSSERGEDQPPRYAWFRFEVTVAGVDQTTAEALVQRFRDTCPIYNTVAAVSPAEFDVRVA
ncbi:OsmC family protein [Parenemella sanctibonifatiensis]|uniref:OsmC family protein n=1 Tax=Parenemella sanctibonifatiensis TaxID=2016505 RepID=UPI0015C67051|nr:OsmC family protein [Parenemella sanctibonifatiensis]